MGRACSPHGRDKKYGFGRRTPKGRDHLEVLGGRIILEWIFGK